MAHLEHVALWVDDLERVCGFYAQHFGAQIGSLYVNHAKGFQSRFLTFESGARLEIMATTAITLARAAPGAQRHGLAHFAIRLGTESAVRELTDRLRSQGVPVLDGPRRTGDGYFESVVLDPEGNRIELVA